MGDNLYSKLLELFISVRQTTTKLENAKVIFNDPATILWINGKKYISKAHDEEFDMEKGLLMCLAKANGISHLKLRKLLESAKIQINKEKKEKKYDF